MTACAFILAIISSDFMVCDADDDQFYPVVEYVDTLYYVFWEDRRFVASETLYAVSCTRVTADGSVLDQDGKVLFRNQVHYDVAAAFDGQNFLVAFEDSC